MKNILPLLALAIAPLAAHAVGLGSRSSEADQPPAACTQDYKRLCGGRVPPGFGRAQGCLFQNRAMLAKECAVLVEKKQEEVVRARKNEQALKKAKAK